MCSAEVKSNVAGPVRHADRKRKVARNKIYNERIRKLYETVSSNPLLTKKTHYMNMGYWKDHPQSLDDACEAMARFMGEFGQFCQDDRVLDAGCGFGDQDIYWAGRHATQKITGINVSQVQVESAQQRVKELGLQDRITIQLGSATNLPFADGSFDKVVALESAQHFGTREDFFGEAYRVLQAGGQIFTADIIPMPGAAIGGFARRAMALNKDNLYSRSVYEQKLGDAGFTNVQVTSIREVVLKPFKKYLDLSAKSASVTERLRRRISSLLVPTYKLDYVIARADKR
jgi:cyclopropane fatty-acyl-phospholipid synthase-like methyltransferase